MQRLSTRYYIFTRESQVRFLCFVILLPSISSDLVGSWVTSYSSPSFCRHDNKPVIANSDINEMLPTYLPAPEKEIFSPAHETFLPSLANKYRRLPFWKCADVPGIDVTIRNARRSTFQGLNNRRCICSLNMHTIEPLERNPCDQGAIILSISKIAREETPSHATTSERHTRRFDVRRFNTEYQGSREWLYCFDPERELCRNEGEHSHAASARSGQRTLLRLKGSAITSLW
jgi:hypothetical protein